MLAAAPAPAAGQPGSARKQELLDAAYQYVLGNGLADMSLRPLAKAIGSSPRVLLFLFGSKEELIQALLARARQDELAYLAALRDGQGLAVTGREIWSWLAAPSHRALLALWVEGYARSLLGEPGPWADFGSQTVRDWLDLLATCQPASLRDTPEGAAERTLLLAVLRGALLDLLATGDTDRVTRAVELHLRERKATVLVAGWLVRPVASGRFATALSRYIEPSGSSEPALAMAACTRSVASRAAAASPRRSAPR